jgi:hypothetical protein
LRFEDVEATVYKDLTVSPVKGIEPRIVAATVTSLMADPPEEVRKYLRSLADTYTLFAFMRETPDVQSAIVKIFADGDIWLDTTVVLPLFAEDLLDPASRAHAHMLHAVRESGSRLHVTEGVIEEITSHIHRSRGYHRALLDKRDVYGPEPFLLSCYQMSGRDLGDFERWLETFCGTARPEDDIIERRRPGRRRRPLWALRRPTRASGRASSHTTSRTTSASCCAAHAAGNAGPPSATSHGG